MSMFSTSISDMVGEGVRVKLAGGGAADDTGHLRGAQPKAGAAVHLSRGRVGAPPLSYWSSIALPS